MPSSNYTFTIETIKINNKTKFIAYDGNKRVIIMSRSRKIVVGYLQSLGYVI